MDDMSGAPWALGGGFAVWLIQAVWTKVFSTEGKANDQLVQQMSDELRSVRERLTTVESGLDEERRLRRLAEDKVHQLQIDNLLLRAELKRHGIEVPEPMTALLPESPR